MINARCLLAANFWRADTVSGTDLARCAKYARLIARKMKPSKTSAPPIILIGFNPLPFPDALPFRTI